MQVKKLKLEELNRLSIEEFKVIKKRPLTLVLDNIRSMNNVGSIFRTADCLAVEKLILCGITGRPPHRDIEKTALGATLSVNWEYKASVSEAIGDLKKSGYSVVAVEQAQGSTMLNEFCPKPGANYALVLGNEVNGVSDEAIALADACIEIPQFGTKHSFNVVVSAGIVLWDFFTKLHE